MKIRWYIRFEEGHTGYVQARTRLGAFKQAYKDYGRGFGKVKIVRPAFL